MEKERTGRQIEAASQLEEVVYRTIISTAMDGFCLVDCRGNFLDMNDAYCRMMGYSRDELLAMKISDIEAKESLEDTIQHMEKVKEVGWDRFETRNRRKEGKIISLEISVNYLSTGGGRFFVFLRDITDRLRTQEALSRAYDELEKRVEERTVELLRANWQLEKEIQVRKTKEEELRESERKLRQLSSQILSAQETERRRISRELHDELGQSLTVMKLRLRSIEQELKKNQVKVSEDCEKSVEYLNQIMENVRRLSRELSPTILEDLGLTAALQWLINNFIANNEMKMTMDIAQIDDLFAQDAQIRIYRIMQEALTNIAKHAQAKNMKVLIEKDKEGISILVEDDGKGFDPRKILTKVSAERGLGLAAMEERARMLGGSLDLWSQEGKGTQISLHIPRGKGQPQ